MRTIDHSPLERFDEAITAFTRLVTAHSNYVAATLLGLGWSDLTEQAFTTASHYFRRYVGNGT